MKMKKDRLYKIVNDAIKKAPKQAKDGCYGPWASVEEYDYVIFLHRCCRDTQLVHYIYQTLEEHDIDTTKILILTEW